MQLDQNIFKSLQSLRKGKQHQIEIKAKRLKREKNKNNKQTTKSVKFYKKKKEEKINIYLSFEKKKMLVGFTKNIKFEEDVTYCK